MSWKRRVVGGLMMVGAWLASPGAQAQEGYAQEGYGEAPPPSGYDDGQVAYDGADQGQDDGAFANASGEFDAALSPYGQWVELPGQGRVWRPSSEVVGADFRPYATNGQWVYTDYGWTFESTYAWGWAPFHYGRWMIEPAYGWVWVPGRTWAPAWVDWRFGGGLVGWAPLAPAGVDIYAGDYRTHWCFVHTANFVSYNVHVNLLAPVQSYQAFAVTSAVASRVSYGSVRYNAGPSPVHIAQAVGRPVAPVSLRPPAPGVVQQVRLASGMGQAAHFVNAPVRAPVLRNAGTGAPGFTRPGMQPSRPAQANPARPVAPPARGPSVRNLMPPNRGAPSARPQLGQWPRPSFSQPTGPMRPGSYVPAARPWPRAPSYAAKPPSYALPSGRTAVPASGAFRERSAQPVFHQMPSQAPGRSGPAWPAAAQSHPAGTTPVYTAPRAFSGPRPPAWSTPVSGPVRTVPPQTHSAQFSAPAGYRPSTQNSAQGRAPAAPRTGFRR